MNRYIIDVTIQMDMELFIDDPIKVKQHINSLRTILTTGYMNIQSVGMPVDYKTTTVNVEIKPDTRTHTKHIFE